MVVRPILCTRSGDAIERNGMMYSAAENQVICSLRMRDAVKRSRHRSDLSIFSGRSYADSRRSTTQYDGIAYLRITNNRTTVERETRKSNYRYCRIPARLCDVHNNYRRTKPSARPTCMCLF